MEYWRFFIIALLIGLTLNWLDTAWIGISVGDYGLLGLVFLLIIVAPALALNVRRLHDFGLCGWWIWLGVVPLFGLLVHLAVLFYPGDAGPNKYGSPPRQPDAS